MPAVALAFSVLAGVLHVAFFAAESILWHRPAIWRAFGVADQAAADASGFFAFNQGFYNLFLAAGAIGGPIAVTAGATTVGWTVVIYACASMLAAATVLRLGGGRAYTRAAAIQGTIPLLAVFASATALIH